MRRITPEWAYVTLFFVGGIFAGAVWYFMSVKNYRTAIWCGFFALVLALLASSLMIRNEVIKREIVTYNHNTEDGSCPLCLDAFMFAEPLQNDSEYAGIKWQENYVGVRVLLRNKGSKTIQDLSLTIQPETPIHDIRQVTQIPDVVFQHGIDIAGVEIVTVDEKGKKTSIPVSFSGPGALSSSYKLFCTRLLSNSKIEIVMACVAPNPAKRIEPKWVRIYGSYNVEGSYSKYQPEFELPLKK